MLSLLVVLIVAGSAGSTSPSPGDPSDGSDPYPVLTASNVTSFIITHVGYENSGKAVDLLMHVAAEQPVDASWASQVVGEVDRILADSGVSAYAEGWTIDCRTSMCVVLFDVDLSEFRGARETIQALEDRACRSALLWYDAKAGKSVFFLFRDNFEYVRAAAAAPL